MSFYRKNYRPRRDGEEPEKCADPAKARARALDALAAREMTSGQLYERLCVRFTEQAAAEAVAEMVELDYVNDDRYAEAKAHSLLAARKSRRAGRSCLFQLRADNGYVRNVALKLHQKAVCGHSSVYFE